MNKVFWLGAGASAGSTLAPQPPTIKSFFKIGRSLGLPGQDDPRRLFETIRQRWGLTEDVLLADEPQVTIETLLSFFDIEERRLQANGQSDFVFDLSHAQLHDYIREVLVRCNGIPDPHESCAHHAAISSALDSTDAVISFNYDLIMDKALADTRRWNEWAGYAPMTFDKIYDVGHWHTTMPSRCDFPQSAELVYLKLHGSINWFRSTGRRSTPQSEELDKIEQDSEHPQQRVLSLFSSHAGARFLMNTNTFFEGQYVEQLVVPPTAYKNYDAFRPLWNKAKDVLASAKELAIIGFSFAPVDIQAQWLLHRGLARNPNAVLVTLVDRDKPTRDRIGKLIQAISSRHQLVRQYDDFWKYVREQYGSVATPR